MISAINNHLYITNDQSNSYSCQKTSLHQQKEGLQLGVAIWLALRIRAVQQRYKKDHQRKDNSLRTVIDTVHQHRL